MCFVHHPICTRSPSNILEPRYLGYLPPSAVVGVSGEARGVVGAAGAGGGADAEGRARARVSSVTHALAEFQELEAATLRGLSEEAWLGGDLEEEWEDRTLVPPSPIQFDLSFAVGLTFVSRSFLPSSLVLLVKFD